MNVTYNFEHELLDERYKDILLEIYSHKIRELIFSSEGEGFHGVECVGLVQRHCFGCQFQCSSQKHHDICLMSFVNQIDFLFEFALAEINEIEVSDLFNQKLSLSSSLPAISIFSQYKYLLDSQWRQNEWLNTFTVFEQLVDRVVCLEHLRRVGAQEKYSDNQG